MEDNYSSLGSEGQLLGLYGMKSCHLSQGHTLGTQWGDRADRTPCQADGLNVWAGEKLTVIKVDALVLGLSNQVNNNAIYKDGVTTEVKINSGLKLQDLLGHAESEMSMGHLLGKQLNVKLSGP